MPAAAVSRRNRNELAATVATTFIDLVPTAFFSIDDDGADQPPLKRIRAESDDSGTDWWNEVEKQIDADAIEEVNAANADLANDFINGTSDCGDRRPLGIVVVESIEVPGDTRRRITGKRPPTCSSNDIAPMKFKRPG